MQAQHSSMVYNISQTINAKNDSNFLRTAMAGVHMFYIYTGQDCHSMASKYLQRADQGLPLGLVEQRL